MLKSRVSIGLSVLAVVSKCMLTVASGVTTDTNVASGQTFDYIVVGAGLTGTTIASRLAENPAMKILVIEAGGDDREDPNIFTFYNYRAVFGSPLDWAWPVVDKEKLIHGRVAHSSRIFRSLTLADTWTSQG